jgi:hypothetical protein
MSTYICPCCFSRNEEKGIKYKCRECGNVFDTKSGSLKKDRKCTNCSSTTNLRLCQKCLFELPYTFGSYQDETFSVIGLKNSGKSHFIAMLVKIFGSRISEQFHVSMEVVHDDISAKFNNMYAGNLDRGIIIDATQAHDDRIRKPLIYKLLFRREGLFGDKKLDVATISLFDNAGEDLFSESAMRKVNQCVFNSTGIIMIIDPLQLPPVREELKVRGVPLPQKSINHEGAKEILTRVAKLIREQSKLSQNQFIEIPLAIAFSKSDVLKSVIGEANSMMFNDSNHKEVLNKKEIEGISNEIEAFISSWDDTGIITQIKNNFKNYCFFGFSALGSNPDGGKITLFRSIRVEDPFLWLLYKRNLIKMK